MSLTVLAIAETRTKGVSTEYLRRRVPPAPSDLFAFVEEALYMAHMARTVTDDPDEIVLRLLRPTKEA